VASRPVWLAAGVVAAAGAAEVAAATAGTAWSGSGGYGGVAGGVPGAGATSVVAAGVVAAGLCLAAGVSVTPARRHGAAAAAPAAALGAALVAARLSLGLVAGAADPAAAGQWTGPLPAEAGTRPAIVLSARSVSGQQLATLHLLDPPLDCAGQLAAYPRLSPGDRIDWTGRIRPLRDTSYDRWLASQGISARCDAAAFAVTNHDTSPLAHLEQLRQAAGDALQRVIPEPEGGLAAAILIGLRDRVDREVATAFTTAGVSHIVAISGWNIAIVAATIAALLGGLARRRRTVVTIGAILAYTLFAGASPSVVRAAVMAGVALAAVESGRGSRATTGLAWAAALMILAEPATVADAGFQLSAAATAGLIAWGSPIAGLLERRAAFVPTPIRDCLGVSLAAQAATLPIILLTFGRLALIAPAANLAAVPLVPPAMAAGLAALGAGALAQAGAPSWLTGLLAMPAWALLTALVGIVELAASVPGASASLPFPANSMVAAVAAALLCPMHRALTRGGAAGDPIGADRGSSHGVRRSATSPSPASRSPAGRRTSPIHRWAVFGAASAVILAGCVVSARPDGSVHVIVLDVGQGDAILVEGDRGGRILVDGGPDGVTLAAALDRYVPPWDRRLDAIVLTHPHDDHVAGLVEALDRYRVDCVFESGLSLATPSYEAWQEVLDAHGLEAGRLATGDSIRLDGATLRVLWPDPDVSPAPGTASENRQVNDRSIVLLGEFAGRRFLLTGDMEDDVDPLLLARGLPRVDLLKVAHHGSATASSEAMLAALRPSVAIVSVGADNDFGHPAGSTLARLREHSSTVLRTDQSGSVEVTLSAASVTVGAERYDSLDVDPQPPGERGLAALARTAGLAPAPFTRRGRDGRLAGLAGDARRGRGRSPAGRSGGAPPRRGQASGPEAIAQRAGPRRRLGALAGRAGPPRAGAGHRRPPRDSPGGRPLVRELAGLGRARGTDRGLRRQAGRAAAGAHGRSLQVVGQALPSQPAHLG